MSTTTSVLQKELQERKRKNTCWLYEPNNAMGTNSRGSFALRLFHLDMILVSKERNGVYGSFVKYPKEMDNPCDETLPSVFHIFPTITINFFQDFLRKKMIKKGHIFRMELILITKCIFVNHEVNLIWFQSLFFLAKNIFFSNKMVSTSLLAVLGLIYCWSGLVSHLFWKYLNRWEEEILCLCKNTFPQLWTYCCF